MGGVVMLYGTIIGISVFIVLFIPMFGVMYGAIKDRDKALAHRDEWRGYGLCSDN